MFDQETREELLNNIQKAVDDTLNEFRKAYPPPRDISSPHLSREITAAIAAGLGGVSEKDWTTERQASTLVEVASITARIIEEFRLVYPQVAVCSSPHIPRAVASRVVGLIDDIVYQIRKERRISSIAEQPDDSKAKNPAQKAKLALGKKG